MKIKIYIFLLIISITANLAYAGPYPGSTYLTYLHTDRSCYVSGDNILLKGYHINLNGTEETPEIALYVDIATINSKFISGKVLKLQEGVSSGVINIPDSLRTGEYLIRAYTSHSLKYNKQEVLFSKRIYVSNRFGNNGNLAIENKNRDFFDTSLVPPISDSKYLKLNFSDSLISTRSKVRADLSIKNSSTFTGSVAVKATSASELYYALKAGNITQQIKSNSLVKSKNEQLLLAESKGIVVKGQVLDKTTNQPLANTIVFVAHEGSQLNFRTAITDENGNFCFLYSLFYGVKTTYVTCFSIDNFKYLPNAFVKFDSRFLDEAETHNVEYFANEYEKSYDTLNLKKSIINRAYKISPVSEEQGDTIVKKSFEELYFINEYELSVNLDEYVEFTDFLEISREVLPFLKTRKHEQGYICSIVDAGSNIVRKNPLILVDGVPLTNMDYLVKWGSDKIKQIDLKIEPRFYGDIVFLNGIVFVWTREQDFWSSISNIPNQKHTFVGFQNPMNIEFPIYSDTQIKSIPDFRQILYWNPSIDTEQGKSVEFDFYTSDEKGLFEVVVEGIVDVKHPVYLRKLIRIE